ncbi:hypothetical protein Tco_0783067 [Tanacetum coccineum]
MGGARGRAYAINGGILYLVCSSSEALRFLLSGDLWNNKQEWEIVRWRLYEACGVCILELKDGTVIYMLVERRYPLSKELLQRMLDLGLEIEEESIDVLQLLVSPGSNSSCDDGDDPMMMMALLLCLPDGEGRRRVEESEVSGWIDRLTRSILGVAGKIPPEKFSGGGWPERVVADRRWGGRTWEEVGERN